jgi:RNA polymerase sigma-70 factor (ECF subfamily)
MGAVGCTLTKLVPALTATGEYRSSQEESLLIGQILEGRKDLFGDLLQPHLTAVLRLVRAKMRNDSEADDVIQQTILKAFTRLEQFRFEASFKTWLIRIAIREVLQWRRSRAPTRFLALDQFALAQLQVTDQAASPLKQCECRETVGLFHRALARLPQKYRVMIHLRDLEGFSISETARLLHLSVPAAKTRHRRARLQMVRFLVASRARPIHDSPPLRSALSLRVSHSPLAY